MKYLYRSLGSHEGDCWTNVITSLEEKETTIDLYYLKDFGAWGASLRDPDSFLGNIKYLGPSYRL